MKILPLLLFIETLAYRRPIYREPVYKPPSMDFNQPQYDLSKLPKPKPVVWPKPSSNSNSGNTYQGKPKLTFIKNKIKIHPPKTTLQIQSKLRRTQPKKSRKKSQKTKMSKRK